MSIIDPFRTRDAVPDFDRYVAEYAARSAATRDRLRAQRHVPYGDTPAEKLDLFFPASSSSPAPVHLFIHGGYWRMLDARDSSFMAKTFVEAGCAVIAIEAGAHGITVHPRPDQRHIRADDVRDLAQLLTGYKHIEFNIEGNPFHGLVDIAKRVKPHQCTLVPDEESASTSDHGWDLQKDGERLQPLISELRALGIEPKVALLSHSNFGSSEAPSAQKMRQVLAILREKAPEMHVDGEMHGDCALDESIRKSIMPDSTLTGDANLLVLPNIDAANISFLTHDHACAEKTNARYNVSHHMYSTIMAS